MDTKTNGRDEWHELETILVEIKRRDLHSREALEASAVLGLQIAAKNAELRDRCEALEAAVTGWVIAIRTHELEECAGWVLEETRAKVEAATTVLASFADQAKVDAAL